MSHLGAGLPPPPPPVPPSGPRPPLLLLAILGVLVLVMIGTGTVVVRRQLDDGGPTAASGPASSPVTVSTPSPATPAETESVEWDPRIAPYAEAAAEERGLEFLHTVSVRFLPSRKFEQTMRSDRDELSAEDRRELENGTGLLRALGLVTGEVDLFSAWDDTLGSGTSAYYSFEEEEVVVRGTEITPAMQPTLVHELTHVLQDQHFDVGDRLEAMEEEDNTRDDDPDDSPAAAGDAAEDKTGAQMLEAVGEGDAERVADLYRASLTPEEQAAIADDSRREARRADDGLADVPPIILTLFASSYTLGRSLVEVAAAYDGNDAVDELFEQPPVHDEALLQPFLVLDDDLATAEVDPPATGPGEEQFDDGELGALTWYLVLAERLPLRLALAATDGWAGDAYLAVEKDGLACMRARYAGRTPSDATRMHAALQRWSAAAPGTHSSVARTGASVLFESCDPGAQATVGRNASARAVERVLARTYTARAFLDKGAPPRVSACIGDGLVRAYSPAQLRDPELGAKDPTMQTVVEHLIDVCE